MKEYCGRFRAGSEWFELCIVFQGLKGDHVSDTQLFPLKIDWQVSL